ncbi:glycosyltransferase family 39 protein [Sulfurovum sp.]|uniref:glycosyltransferase family 39 protein n=1 Tax=Sulfurovum sp. TaxID=1969726 RepID=UPI002868367F|nr:glycosyltransferase family 39 protein [Sulfurovum sp.]
MKKQHLILSSLIYICAVFYLAITTPIGPHEAKTFYTSTDIVSVLMHWGDTLLGGFIGIRIFFIFLGFLTIILFYEMSKRYFSMREDAYLATILFMFLPGIITVTTLVNVGILVLPLVLFFVLMYERQTYWPLPFIMLALFFLHESSIVFFVALFFYALVHKDNKLGITSTAFLIAFFYLEKGIEIGGRPSGHFVEVFGLYATVFSPFLFLYFFYAMYRILLREKKRLIWYISFTALAFSLVLSIRQRVYITDFAPYVMISMVLMLDVFNHSMRVRLPEFQKHYMRGFYVVLFFLALSDLLVVSHKVSYELTDNPDKHFAHRIYKPYYLAQDLKKEGKECYDASTRRERYQLRFYEIQSCATY